MIPVGKYDIIEKQSGTSFVREAPARRPKTTAERKYHKKRSEKICGTDRKLCEGELSEVLSRAAGEIRISLLRTGRFLFESALGLGQLTDGYRDDAVLLAEKTVRLFGQDVERCGEFHEYYHPETGEGVLNQGFQSWNLLAYNLAEDLKNGDFDRMPDKEEV